jgi:hypothetical protein
MHFFLRCNPAHYLLLVLLFMTSYVQASETETVIVLEARSAKGKKITNDVLLLKNGSVVVNNERLTPAEAITQSNHIKSLAQIPARKLTLECDAGYFIHIIKREKDVKSEKGCIDGARYKGLRGHFKALKKDSLS